MMADPIAGVLASKVGLGAILGGTISALVGHGRWYEKLARAVVGVTLALMFYEPAAPFFVAMLAKVDTYLGVKRELTQGDAHAASALVLGAFGIAACEGAMNAMKAWFVKKAV